MPISKTVIDHLVCPQCGDKINRKSNANWECPAGHNYIEVDGVPILRDTAQVPISPQGGGAVANATTALKKNGLIALAREIIGTNYVPYPVNFDKQFGPEDSVLNVGAGMSSNSSGHIGLDFFLFPNIDIVGDAANLPFENGVFDYVVSEFMIEHVPNPMKVIQEMCRVLKPGGKLYISYPFIHSYHSFPEDYFRFSHTGLRAMLPESTSVVDEGPLTGPVCNWISTTADTFTFWVPNQRIRFVLRALLLLFMSPVKLLDRVLNKHPKSIFYSTTLYTIVRKDNEND